MFWNWRARRDFVRQTPRKTVDVLYGWFSRKPDFSYPCHPSMSNEASVHWIWIFVLV